MTSEDAEFRGHLEVRADRERLRDQLFRYSCQMVGWGQFEVG